MGPTGRACVNENLNIDRVLDSYEQLYRSLGSLLILAWVRWRHGRIAPAHVHRLTAATRESLAAAFSINATEAGNALYAIGTRCRHCRTSR
jgi:hypothetical protein